MSFYNIVFGVNKYAPFLLSAIGLTFDKIPRFRDCFVSNGMIVVYTRTGGGNRDFYDSEQSCRDKCPEYFGTGGDEPSGPWNADLRANKYYDRDEDAEEDCSYAYFYFRFPDEYSDDLKAFEQNNQWHTPTEKWSELFNRAARENRTTSLIHSSPSGTTPSDHPSLPSRSH